MEIFGESHGTAIGVVVDGVMPGIELGVEDFMPDILRRKSGAKGTTSRIEADEPEILSGVFEGHTTGAPVAIIFRNNNTRSSDYEALKAVPRPGHADYVASVKWNGFNDPRGGGHFSGRITLPLVAAGVIAKKMCQGLSFEAGLIEIGGETDKSKWGDLLDKTSKEGDSLGGIVECRVSGVPAGLGEPFFDSVESLISHAVFSIPGVRGIEFGDGFASARMKGSEHNDSLELKEGSVTTVKNGSGGINGGITNGMPVIFRCAVRPTPSISQKQRTVSLRTGENADLEIHGRHDPCILPRAVPVVEAMAAIGIMELWKERAACLDGSK